MLEHKFCHIEIPVTDIDKAKEFYESVFNWEVQLQTGYPGYAFFKTGESGVGGAFGKKDTTGKDGIILHIETDDIPKTLTKIKKAGGKVTKEKTDIGNDFGFYALFEDNSGNLLGIWSQK